MPWWLADCGGGADRLCCVCGMRQEDEEDEEAGVVHAVTGQPDLAR